MSNTVEQNTELLVAALAAFLEDGDTGALQDVYRQVHVSQRASVQTSAFMALPAAMTVEVLDAFNNLPTVTSSRVTRSLTDDEVTAIRQRLGDAIGNVETFEDEFVQDAMTGVVTKLLRIIDHGNVGRSVTTYDDEPTDYVPAGSTIEGHYKGATVSAILNADNTVTLDDETFDSLSAAAKSVVGRSQNGWMFWRFEGNTVASMRG